MEVTQEIIQYAPYILIVVMFCANYQIFVTPSRLEEKLKDYVLKETHDISYQEMKNDIAEMKQKIDKIYDKVMAIS